MAIRILEADLQAHVTNVLMAVKRAVEAARSQGLIAELPEKMDFQVEVVTAAQSLVSENTQTTTETDTMARTTTRVEGGRTNTNTEGGTTGQTTTGTTGESGGDSVQTDYTYT